MPRSPLIHFELCVNDRPATRAFYADVLGWEITPTSMPHYDMIATGQAPEGGLMQKPPAMPHAAMNVYFYVDDVAATLAKATAAGGQVVLPPMDIPNVGTAGMFRDPEGIVIGVFCPRME
jgi:predicted enzyme related to lactoylglutathione lyase